MEGQSGSGGMVAMMDEWRHVVVSHRCRVAMRDHVASQLTAVLAETSVPPVVHNALDSAMYGLVDAVVDQVECSGEYTLTGDVIAAATCDALAAASTDTVDTSSGIAFLRSAVPAIFSFTFTYTKEVLQGALFERYAKASLEVYNLWDKLEPNDVAFVENVVFSERFNYAVQDLQRWYRAELEPVEAGIMRDLEGNRDAGQEQELMQRLSDARETWFLDAVRRMMGVTGVRATWDTQDPPSTLGKLLCTLVLHPQALDDVHGSWLQGNEIELLPESKHFACDEISPSVADDDLSEHVTVVDDVEQLHLLPGVRELLHEWQHPDIGRSVVHVFIVGTMSELLYERRGHWLSLTAFKLQRSPQAEPLTRFLVTDSLGQDRRDDARVAHIMHFLQQKHTPPPQ